ncbi:MAG TPA: hypothetical protein VMU73_06745, partial [Gaiellaceae bacterium]|nr:hypothetical protein [Gaiellaceae bacterium]
LSRKSRRDALSGKPHPTIVDAPVPDRLVAETTVARETRRQPLERQPLRAHVLTHDHLTLPPLAPRG